MDFQVATVDRLLANIDALLYNIDTLLYNMDRWLPGRFFDFFIFQYGQMVAWSIFRFFYFSMKYG